MLVELEEYKSYLKIYDTKYDSELTSFILSVENRVKNFLNSEILARDYIELYSGNDSSYLSLNKIPIISVSKVEKYDIGTKTWGELLLNVDYYRMEIIDNLLFLEGYMFEMGEYNYRITYRAGYETVPDLIKHACKELVKLYYDDSPYGNNRLGLVNINDGISGSQNYSIDREAEAKILNKILIYKNYYV